MIYIFFACMIFIGISIEIKLKKVTDQSNEVINLLKHSTTRENDL